MPVWNGEQLYWGKLGIFLWSNTYLSFTNCKHCILVGILLKTQVWWWLISQLLDHHYGNPETNWCMYVRGGGGHWEFVCIKRSLSSDKNPPKLYTVDRNVWHVRRSCPCLLKRLWPPPCSQWRINRLYGERLSPDMQPQKTGAFPGNTWVVKSILLSPHFMDFRMI